MVEEHGLEPEHPTWVEFAPSMAQQACS